LYTCGAINKYVTWSIEKSSMEMSSRNCNYNFSMLLIELNC